MSSSPISSTLKPTSIFTLLFAMPIHLVVVFL